MKKILISQAKPQYRANLHCHTTVSDGSMTPEEAKAAYRGAGYDILAITDHELPRSYAYMSEPDFLMLTGYEAFVRVNPNYVFDPYAPEVHLNFFAKDPLNETVICYNKASNKFFPKNNVNPDAMRRAGSERTREYTVSYVNEMIRTAVENGYLVAYNHPAWSMEDEEAILAYENIFSLEIDNYSSLLCNGLEHGGALYDKMLRRRQRVFCHAGDDNHNGFPKDDPRWDSFGAWTMILADELSYDAVIGAMERGDMYASTGPAIKELSFEDGVVHVECSEAVKIHIFNGSKNTPTVFGSEENPLTSADLKLDEKAPFFFVVVVDKNGGMATSRGYFRNEL
jgi:hypothetical protein